MNPVARLLAIGKMQRNQTSSSIRQVSSYSSHGASYLQIVVPVTKTLFVTIMNLN
ncbi:hypothetical protein MLPF_0920 [Mycobacterium lepromatosis]|nr:hypothetical protein MLPF_0920 [Mycobacterium lepromatosis]